MERTRSPKFSKPVFTCGDGLRFSTPEIVGRYRTKRLKCSVLADISCGIGGQAVCFAKECGSVYGIDIDGERLECARRNAVVYGVDNITFIEGDALSPQVVEQVADADVDVDVIFSDPARPAEEDVRQTDSLRPGIPMVMEAYRDVTGSFAFEAPPQMPPGRIDFDCEREYLSVDGQLNRLTLYFGPLKSCERSAVVLKGDRHYRLESGVSMPAGIPGTDEILPYAFEPDPAVVKAELLGELAAELNINMGLVKIDARRSLLTSLSNIDSPFFKNRYRVLDNGESQPENNSKAKKGRISRDELYANVEEITSLSYVFVILSLLSSVVAAIGIMQNNVAVIIGAMVIAPLLGPNVALSLATTLGDIDLAKRALKANMTGILTVLSFAAVIGYMFKVDPNIPELISRTKVSLGDVILAMAAGSAAALSLTTGVASALIGVMVAVALLPPLVVFGMLIGQGEWQLAMGAMLLVLTNLICINLSGVVTFLAQGIRPRKYGDADRAKKATQIAIVLWTFLLILLVVLIILSQNGWKVHF